MNIYGSPSFPPARDYTSPSPSTYASANQVTANETRDSRSDVAAARDTALSALRNDRFGTMLQQITGPAASGALMTMTRDAASADADFNAVASSYAENGE